MPKVQPLEYQPAEPTFLRRLKANHASLDGRHNVQIPRARGGKGVSDRLNMNGEEGDDEPVMIDESGNVVSREEMERMGGEGEEKVGVEGVKDGGGQSANQVLDPTRKPDHHEKVTSGFGRKRKAVKVITDDVRDDTDGTDKVERDDKNVKTLTESTNDLKSVVSKGKEEAKKEEAGKKGKRRKVMLSFDEPE